MKYIGIKVDSKKKKKANKLVLIKERIRRISSIPIRIIKSLSSLKCKFQFIKMHRGNRKAVNKIKKILTLSIPKDIDIGHNSLI